MSAKHLQGINLDRCACGESPIRRTEPVGGGTAVHWVACPQCGTHTAKQECEADAEFAWNEGDVLQPWHMPIELVEAEQLALEHH